MPTCLQLSPWERQAGFRGIELNTNGLVIARNRNYLRALKEAGLTEIYLQFDGLAADVTRTLRGADLLSDKLRPWRTAAARESP